MNAGFIKPLHSSTNPEILVKIRSVVSEIDLLQGRPLKIKKKNIGKYRPIARRSGMPGGLKNKLKHCKLAEHAMSHHQLSMPIMNLNSAHRPTGWPKNCYNFLRVNFIKN